MFWVELYYSSSSTKNVACVRKAHNAVLRFDSVPKCGAIADTEVILAKIALEVQDDGMWLANCWARETRFVVSVVVCEEYV